MATSLSKPIQRWTAKRRAELVVCLLRDETTPTEAADEYGLDVAEINNWKARFLGGATNALRSRPRDEVAEKNEQIRIMKQKIGELILHMDELRASVAARRDYRGLPDEPA